MRVVRAFALDTQRHLSIFGRYPGFMSLPDRWQSWILGGVLAGVPLVRKWRPSVILSTYPLASAHAIGMWLHRLTGTPWVADFRDPMAQDNYPTDPRVHRSFVKLERAVFRHAARVTVTTPGTADLYAERFPDFPRQSIRVIQNGFDEELFAGVLPAATAERGRNGGTLTLVHSGLLYPHERNPTQFFEALGELKREGRIAAGEVQVLLRGSGNEESYAAMIAQFGLTDIVKLLPAVPYRTALEELCAADGCLIFQGPTCNQQIPAKVYEYLYAGKPILALTDHRGDTARLLRDAGATSIAALDDRAAIKAMLPAFLERLRSGTEPVAGRSQVMQYSRRTSTGVLARLLDEVSARG